MPTYNYKCNNCGYTFSVVQKMSDSPVTTCEICNGKVTRRITGGTGLIFKGSGFYLTDYARKQKETKPGKTKMTENNKAKSNSAELKT